MVAMRLFLLLLGLQVQALSSSSLVVTTKIVGTARLHGAVESVARPATLSLRGGGKETVSSVAKKLDCDNEHVEFMLTEMALEGAGKGLSDQEKLERILNANSMLEEGHNISDWHVPFNREGDSERWREWATKELEKVVAKDTGVGRIINAEGDKMPRIFCLHQELDDAEKGLGDGTVSYGVKNPRDMDLLEWDASILGPPGSPLDSRYMSLRIFCGPRYPEAAPEVSFISKVNLPFVDKSTGAVIVSKCDYLKRWTDQHTLHGLLLFLRQSMLHVALEQPSEDEEF